MLPTGVVTYLFNDLYAFNIPKRTSIGSSNDNVQSNRLSWDIEMAVAKAHFLQLG